MRRNSLPRQLPLRYQPQFLPAVLFATLATLLVGCSYLFPARVEVEPGAERKGYSERPLNAGELTAEIPENSLYLYQDADFAGDNEIITSFTSLEAGAPLDNLGKVKDKMSSLRWNIPRGVVVVFYQHREAEGRQLVVWGQGEYISISRWDMENAASRWAWFYIGGATNPSPQVAVALSRFPLGAHEPSQTPSYATMHLFVDASRGGTSELIGPIVATTSSRYHTLGETEDRMSSLAWNLPPGVLVLLHQHRAGRGAMLGLWGTGQYDRVSPHGFENMVSRWSWYFLGTK